MGATSGAVTAHPFRASELIPGILCVSLAQSLVSYEVFCI